MEPYQLYLLLKSLHIIFMVAWFAGLFYLPRLFVYHCDTFGPDGSVSDEVGNNRFKLMEHRLLKQITTPAAVLTLVSGFLLITIQGFLWFIENRWMHYKLAMIAFLIGYHCYIGYHTHLFNIERNKKSRNFFRIINELPVIALIVIVLLAVIKPSLVMQ